MAITFFTILATSPALKIITGIIALIIIISCLSIKKVNAQEVKIKPFNVLKFSVITDGDKNKFSLLLYSLKEKTGWQVFIPQRGMDIGFGLHNWLSKGSLFNPLSVGITKNQKGITIGNIKIWNILSTSVDKLKIFSMTYYTKALKGKDNFFTRNELLIISKLGDLGARMESFWQKKWNYILGPVYKFYIEKKASVLLFLNLIENRTLKLELSVSF
jgi:hypothetical protein